MSLPGKPFLLILGGVVWVAAASSILWAAWRFGLFAGGSDEARRPVVIIKPTTLIYSLSPVDSKRNGAGAEITEIQKEQVTAIVARRLERLDPNARILPRSGNELEVSFSSSLDAQRVRRIVERRGSLEFRLAVEPDGQEAQGLRFKDRDGETLLLEAHPFITDRMVKDANTTMDEYGTGALVHIDFTDAGAKQLAKITGENVGRSLAIVVDGIVHSAPCINEPIGGGEAVISGGFSLEEADALTVALRSGALPVELVFIRER